MDEDNRRRTFGPVASLDAWHEGFTAKRQKSKLCVDVAFAEARLGGEPEAEVRFRLRLKRAEVVVVVPPFEKIGIDRASISRDAPQVKAKRTSLKETQAHSGAKVGAGIKVGAAGAKGSASADGAAGVGWLKKATQKVIEETGLLSVMQVETEAGEYAWIIEPAVDEVLHGRPWNARSTPRLALTDLRDMPGRGLEPAVHVEIRCRREDLEIRDIAPKDGRSLVARAKDPLWQNKMRAAEAVIRTRLARAGLLRGDINDPFAEIVLCAAIAAGGAS